MDIRPLTVDAWPDLAALFEEGGDPKWCWCTYFRIRGRDWTNSTAAGNRAELRALAERGPAPGLVAFRDGRAVGWVSLAPRAAYDRLTASRVLAPIDDRPVWSIVCFVVSRRVRGQGVAAALLDAAVDYARSAGATLLEAYPVETGPGRIRPAEAYRGTLGMFERAGFRVVERRRWNALSPVRPIVRLALDGGVPAGPPED